MSLLRPRFTLRTLMIAVAVVGFILGGLDWLARELEPDLTSFQYRDKHAAHNSRLRIGQTVVVYSQDGAPFGSWQGGYDSIPAGTKATVTSEAPSDDDIIPRRPVGVTILEGPRRGSYFSIVRHHLRDPRELSVPTPPEDVDVTPNPMPLAVAIVCLIVFLVLRASR